LFEPLIRRYAPPSLTTGRKKISPPSVHAKGLVAHVRTKLRQALLERALGRAIASCEQTHRPVGAEDQAILAKALGGVRDERKQTFRMLVVPPGLGGETRNLAPDIVAGGECGRRRKPPRRRSANPKP
jgi:hypothetical protein